MEKWRLEIFGFSYVLLVKFCIVFILLAHVSRSNRINIYIDIVKNMITRKQHVVHDILLGEKGKESHSHDEVEEYRD